MRLSFGRNMGLLVLAVMGLPSRSYGGTIVTVPPGLAPGSQYRLAFVTLHGYTAQSSSITDYNNDVNNEANSVTALAALGTTWLDIGSTATVNAIDNIGIDAGVPIYELEGNLVANDAGTEAGGMFSWSIFAPIRYTETGADFDYGVPVWTGTKPNGVQEDPEFVLGACCFPMAGIVSYVDYHWITGFGAGDPAMGLPLYGISEILTVPESATPEPSTTAMVILGGALTFFARRRVHGNRRATRTLC